VRNEAIRKVIWWVCLFVAPLVLVGIELFHPAGFTVDPGAYQYLSHSEPYKPMFQALAYPGPDWWFTLHMIQTPMVALVCVGLWLMLRGAESSDGVAIVAVAWLARIATFIFLIYYTALDAIGGFGLARTILITESHHLPPAQLTSVINVINATWTDHWVGGVGSFVSETGSWAAFASAGLTAVALLLSRTVSWPPLVLLVAFGWELQESHTMPHGPIAFGLLALSSLWIWWADRRSTTAVTIAPGT
jgi:hypothetical protein